MRFCKALLVSDNVSVLLGKEGGTFTGPTNFAAGNALVSVAVGDFDGDSDPDLAVANQLSNNVSVLLGDGQGAFGTRTNFTAGDAPTSVAVGDFDGDSHPDLAVANFNGDDVSVLLNDTNHAPVAVGDSYATDEDKPLNVAAPGVLANDTDPDGDSLGAAVATGPSNGTLKLDADGSFTYTPDKDYNGTDSFTYKASDGSLDSALATVTIDVAAVNDAPVATYGAETVDQGAGPIRLDLGALVSDKETADENLAYDVISGPTPEQGVLTGSGAALNFDPAGDYSGPVEIRYTVTDRGDPDGCGAVGAGCAAPLTSNPATVRITVTDTATPDTSISSGPSGIVRSASASFRFSSTEAGSKFECKLDAGAFAPCASPKSYSALKDGKHAFSVRATDAAGNADATPARRTWVVDNAKPTISAVSTRLESTNGDRTLTVRATVKDNLTNLSEANVKLYVNGAPISPTKYSYSASTDRLVYKSQKVSKGKKTVKIVATDAAKNVRTATWYFTIK